MVNQSLTTRLAKERLEAIKKFIPVRDRVRDKLQQRQQSQTDLSVSSEQLFSPITTATKDVKTATERAIYGDIPEEGQRREMPILGVLEKIAAETEKTQQGIKQLSGDLQTQHEIARLGDIDTEPIEKEEDQPQGATGGENTPKRILHENAIETIKGIDDNELVDFAARSFEKKRREGYIISGRENKIKTIDDWSRMVFLANRGIDRLPGSRNDEYRVFKAAVKKRKDETKYSTPKQSGPLPWLQQPKMLFSSQDQKPSTGSGYSNHAVTCPGNILGDISRLEVLIGGKRAGNNSAEIINEAADISRRLFAGGVMDIGVYRELIAELTENHRDAYEYYSD